MAISNVLQSFFILVIVLLYTATVWKSLDSYFRDEFKKHLKKDSISIQKLKRDKIEMAKGHETNKVVDDLDGITNKLTKESVDTFSAEIKISCNKEMKPANKYKNQEESADNYLDDSEMCPFIPPTNINKDGGG